MQSFKCFIYKTDIKNEGWDCKAVVEHMYTWGPEFSPWGGDRELTEWMHMKCLEKELNKCLLSKYKTRMKERGGKNRGKRKGGRVEVTGETYQYTLCKYMKQGLRGWLRG